ncbi:unnamed protein product [Cylicocyclus nassatus]|uniref:Uncharacterized protein n=1 Tax=Cylicocyclus nassatus TaxID=53992 RepID=A0AA36HH46_CYLNA|nr:unnamed protein product [Cylicocyclus nassatus]
MPNPDISVFSSFTVKLFTISSLFLLIYVYGADMMDEIVYAEDHNERGTELPTDIDGVRQYVPVWAVWLFAACFLLIIVVLLLDYCVIRRNALGNNCCTRARQKRNPASAIHQKRSTNMLLNVWKLNRQAQCTDQDV